MKIYEERGEKGGERERPQSDEVILKISPHLGLATNLNSVKGNYYYPHFRNDEREADILCG